LLGKKSIEVEILKEALEVAAGSKKRMLWSLSLPTPSPRDGHDDGDPACGPTCAASGARKAERWSTASGGARAVAPAPCRRRYGRIAVERSNRRW
jgi:hypothetical protein